MSSTTTLKAVLLGSDVSMSKTLKGAGTQADHTKRRMGNLRTELKSLGKGTGSFKGVATGAFKDVGVSAGGLGGKMGLLAGGVAGVAAIGVSALIPFAKDSIDAFKGVASEVNSLKRAMGSTPEEASRLRFAFTQVGIEAGTGQKAIQLFSKKLDAGKGSAKAHAKLVHDLGFEYLDASGKIKPMADLIPQVADRFAKMPDGAEKTALAMKLFGRSGAEIIPFLNKGAKGLGELAKKSDEYGLTLSGKNLQAMKDSKAAQRDMDAAVLGLKVRFGADLLPMLTKVVIWFTTKVIPALVTAGKWWEKHQDTITKVASFIGRAIEAMWKIQTTIWKAMGAAIKVVGAVFDWLWNNAVQPALRFIIGGLANLMRFWARMLGALGNVPGFGWAKTASKNMEMAANKADVLASNIRKIPNKKVTVTVTTNYVTRNNKPAVLPGDIFKQKRAGGGPTLAGRTYLVGENGPELWSEGRSGHVTPARQTAAIMGGRSAVASTSSGRYAGPEVVQVVIDGKVVGQALLRQQRLSGPIGLR